MATRLEMNRLDMQVAMESIHRLRQYRALFKVQVMRPCDFIFQKASYFRLWRSSLKLTCLTKITFQWTKICKEYSRRLFVKMATTWSNKWLYIEQSVPSR